MMHWQEIDTMPDEFRDGRDVLLLSYMCDDASIGRWDNRKQRWVGRCDGRDCIESQHDIGGTTYLEIDIPDYWCPLPTPLNKVWRDKAFERRTTQSS